MVSNILFIRHNDDIPSPRGHFCTSISLRIFMHGKIGVNLPIYDIHLIIFSFNLVVLLCFSFNIYRIRRMLFVGCSMGWWGENWSDVQGYHHQYVTGIPLCVIHLYILISICISLFLYSMSPLSCAPLLSL